MEQRLSLAVCDDERTDAKRVKGALTGGVYPFTLTVDVFYDGQTLLEQAGQKKYDLVFLDIEMPHINGFSLAETLRSLSEGTEIVFVSSHEHLVYQSFSFRPFYFVRKTFLEEELPGVLRAFWNTAKKQDQFCEFRTATGRRKMDLSQIIYMESLDHDLYIYHTEGVFSCRDKIGDRERELAAYGFVRVHRGYLVNCEYIRQLGRSEVMLKNGKSLPLSAGRKKAVADALALFLNGGGKRLTSQSCGGGYHAENN